MALAVEWALVLRLAKCRSPFGKLLGLTVAKHFADQMVPTAGMSGNLVLVDRLKEISGSRPVALAALIMTIIGYYASYGFASLLALALLWWHGQISWVVVALISASLGLSARCPRSRFGCSARAPRRFRDGCAGSRRFASCSR